MLLFSISALIQAKHMQSPSLCVNRSPSIIAVDEQIRYACSFSDLSLRSATLGLVWLVAVPVAPMVWEGFRPLAHQVEEVLKGAALPQLPHVQEHPITFSRDIKHRCRNIVIHFAIHLLRPAIVTSSAQSAPIALCFSRFYPSTTLAGSLGTLLDFC